MILLIAKYAMTFMAAPVIYALNLGYRPVFATVGFPLLSVARPCLPLLTTVRHLSPVSTAADKARHPAGTNERLTRGLVSILRFGLVSCQGDKSRREWFVATLAHSTRRLRITDSLEVLAVGESRRRKDGVALGSMRLMLEPTNRKLAL